MSEGSTRYPLAGGQPPPWACAWGVDRYGTFASFGVGGVIQTMRWIPAGRFRMGSPDGEDGRYGHEGPVHEVTLTRGYWLAETPCTQALWEAVMGRNPSHFQSPTRPVEQVDWDEAQTFLERLERLVPLTEEEEAWRFRLPTEAEWEYACRAGTKTSTYAGALKILGENNGPLLDSVAWYGGNSGVDFDLEVGWDSSGWPKKQHEHTRAGTRIVGHKDPNPWGLYDMLGNVYEWCADWYGPYAAAAAVDPVGAAEGSLRVCRGGSWLTFARGVRAAYRDGVEPGVRCGYLGFRLARGHVRSSK